MPEETTTVHHHGQGETVTQEHAQPSQERGYEIGKDEAWFANVKRTYDEFLHESLADVRQARKQQDEMFNERVQLRDKLNNQHLESLTRGRGDFDKNSQNITEQLSAMSDKQLNDSQLATDRQWNVDEVADLVAKNGVQSDALMTALIKAVVAEIEKNKD